jgi:hypothetical protein
MLSTFVLLQSAADDEVIRTGGGRIVSSPMRFVLYQLKAMNLCSTKYIVWCERN